MGIEGCAVAGGKGGHARGVGVELMLVEDGKVVGLDAAESYFVAHFSAPGQVLDGIRDVADEKCPDHLDISSSPRNLHLSLFQLLTLSEPHSSILGLALARPSSPPYPVP
jgi:hypothetical protein